MPRVVGSSGLSEPLPATPLDDSPESIPGAPDERSSRLSHEAPPRPSPVYEPRLRTNVFLFVVTLISLLVFLGGCASHGAALA